ncbi:isochorismatase family protein [Candidatus Bipolaricaulota bacterium]|nr:isochorismatase family protein [Candidatus Bipolaricaulota bacterium]
MTESSGSSPRTVPKGTTEAEIVHELGVYLDRATLIETSSYSAFFATDLYDLLQRLGVKELTVCRICADIYFLDARKILEQACHHGGLPFPFRSAVRDEQKGDRGKTDRQARTDSRGDCQLAPGSYHLADLSAHRIAATMQ